MGNLAYKVREKKKTQVKKRPQSVKKPAQPKLFTLGEKILFVIFWGIVLTLAITMVSNYATIYSLNRNIHELEAQTDEKVKENHDLELQVTELSSPERIIKIAKEELGMTLNNDKIKVIKNSQ